MRFPFWQERGAMSQGQSQNPIIPERNEKTISRVDSESGKGLIQRVTVTVRERLSKTVGYDIVYNIFIIY